MRSATVWDMVFFHCSLHQLKRHQSVVIGKDKPEHCHVILVLLRFFDELGHHTCVLQTPRSILDRCTDVAVLREEVCQPPGYNAEENLPFDT